MPRVAIGRCTFLVLGLLGIGASIWCALEASAWSADFQQWLVARPLDVLVDFSEPGETTAAFQQTCSVAHAQVLYLEIDLDAREPTDTEHRFEGLSGNVTITDSHGVVVASDDFDGDTAHFSEGRFRLSRITPFARGDHVATIRVESGAAGLGGTAQRLHAEYELCGLELLPSKVFGVCAVVFGLFGLVVMSCVLPGLVRSGFRREDPESASGPDDAPETSAASRDDPDR